MTRRPCAAPGSIFPLLLTLVLGCSDDNDTSGAGSDLATGQALSSSTTSSATGDSGAVATGEGAGPSASVGSSATDSGSSGATADLAMSAASSTDGGVGGTLASNDTATTSGSTTSNASAVTVGNSSAGGTTAASTVGGADAGQTSTATATSAGAGGSAGTGGESPACADNQISACSGTNPIECHFGGDPGDYQVTIELGGEVAGDMIVEAESYRRVLGQVATAAGETRRFSFFVNVRQPEGQPIQNVSAGTPGIDVYVRGTAPVLTAICYEKSAPAPKLWIAGDSTVCDQDGTDYAGWGQHLPQFLAPPVSVANYADSGESSGSFLGSGSLWGAIESGWSAGDWVLIQFGHNDKEVTAETFRSNLSSMVAQAKAAGVHPVLVTPISRVGYALEEEHINSTGANLPQIVRDLAASESVPVIDLTVTTWNWIETIDYTQYFALGTDHTHTNPRGAEVIASFVTDAIRDQKFGLEGYLR